MKTSQQKDAKDAKAIHPAEKRGHIAKFLSEKIVDRWRDDFPSPVAAELIIRDWIEQELAEHFPETTPSKERPTEPGWYWQIINNQATVVVIVRAPSGRLWVNGLFHVEELSGEWVRIEPPISLCPLRPSVPPSPPLFPSLPSVHTLPSVPTT